MIKSSGKLRADSRKGVNKFSKQILLELERRPKKASLGFFYFVSITESQKVYEWQKEQSISPRGSSFFPQLIFLSLLVFKAVLNNTPWELYSFVFFS